MLDKYDSQDKYYIAVPHINALIYVAPVVWSLTIRLQWQ